ncbi:MAG: bifunctional diaminohydroxyphosphoribosylaminopyrimidine deaminase/5-amino-6-(5-phosphoribosylamino)uracil reductase RibD [Planctomycetota bacterium]|nr:MAG: bifunctional diaminohydroxyphosphoribosylaminopyrimidine deaminase/5-amino-6-(5-phosphoribosylamino)uracil reductase RibD [Planctomycetota bacterium]
MSLVHDDRDKVLLDCAARAGLRGFGLVEPNPMVGAVLSRDGRIIGIGHHRRFGGLHAEREALANCRARGEDPRGATMHVTLEPCRHHGKQPPCTDALIEAGVARVIYAAADPHEQSGGGANVLRTAGVDVRQSNASAAALHLSQPFAKRVKTGLPWIIAKWAQTIDGRIATRTGESKWISNDRSRRRVHQLRAKVDAVLAGLGTVAADDPMLTARGVHRRRTAKRVVIDRELHINPDSKLVLSASREPTLIACSKDLIVSDIAARKRDALEAAGVTLLGVPDDLRGVHLPMLFSTLVERCGVSTVLVESGPGLLGALFEADLVDEAIVYIAPLLLGDDLAKSVATGRVASSLTEGRRFELVRAKRLGHDVELVYRRMREDQGNEHNSPPDAAHSGNLTSSA